jgi:hypothetical protein
MAAGWAPRALLPDHVRLGGLEERPGDGAGRCLACAGPDQATLVTQCARIGAAFVGHIDYVLVRAGLLLVDRMDALAC